MTLEEAIKHCKDVALSCTNKECALEHFQLLKWLQDYNNIKNQWKANDLPEKYKTCNWMWNYRSIGLTEEYIKRLNNVISILESLNEHTDAKYLKEIKDKLLSKFMPQQLVGNKEDEIALQDALWCCKQAASIAKDENEMGNVWYAEKWLKSLKERMRGE